MSEDNLAEKFRPVKWEDYVGQGNGTGGAIDVLKAVISKNLHSKIRNLLVSGNPGVGKSSLSSLFAKATLCYNRKPGESEPCGECAVCKGEDVSNIHHYTISSASEARVEFKNLIQLSYQYPIKLSEDPSKFRRIIIIDEFELATPELAAMILDPIEHSPETTTWIINSMDLEKLERRDPAVREAIESRCIWLPLSKLNVKDIANKLTSNIPSLTISGALSIAKLADGNMRRAWNILSELLILNKPEDLTEEIVFRNKIGGATKNSRLLMWEALGKGDANLVKSIVESWMNNSSDSKLLGQLLQQDIVDNMNKPNLEIQSLLSSIGRWQYTGLSYPLISVLMAHLGTNIIQFPSPKEQEIRKENKKSATKDIKSLIAEKTTKALCNNKRALPILLVKSYKELLAHYTSE